MKKRFWVLLALCSLLGLSLFPVEAAPLITLSPVWRPASQLTSIDLNGDGITDAGDDIRYVTVDIYASTNVEFWAVGLSCTVNKALLETYTQFGDPNSSEDETPQLAIGSSWGTNAVQTSTNTVDTDGKMGIAISLRGSENPPLGSNGVTETWHLATLKYRVREDITSAGTSTFQCTSNFLNNDGRVVLQATYVAPPLLNIITGYTLSGKVTYQAATTAPTSYQGIMVTCDDADSDTLYDDVVTTANVTTGLYSVNNLRMQGRYDCNFSSNLLINRFPIHLSASTNFNLTTNSISLLPIVLRSGDMAHSGLIDAADITMVTSNWNAPLTILTSPYMLGDATGDKRINEMDLAVVAGNYNMTAPTSAQHLIFSLPRDAASSFNNHLWLGDVNSASVSLFGAATSRDYWPAVSPGGNLIAFIRNVGTGTADNFALFVAPIVNGVMGAAVRISSTTATYDAFAPSWSPDGSQLAFVCSYNDDWFIDDSEGARGNICLVDANGGNFRALTYAGTNAFFRSKLQQPAWLNNQSIYFTHVTDPNILHDCNGQICLFNIQRSVFIAMFSVGLGADMPVVRTTPMGLTLFYRFDLGGGARFLRYALLDADGLPISTFPSTGHGNIGITPGYYTVATGSDPDIIYYVRSTSTYASGQFFQVMPFNGNLSNPSWMLGINYSISDGFSNPALASGYADALINTVAYLP